MSQDRGDADNASRMTRQYTRQIGDRIERTVSDHDPRWLVRHRVERDAVSERERRSEADRGPGEIEIAADRIPDRNREDHNSDSSEGVTPPSRNAARRKRNGFVDLAWAVPHGRIR